MASSPASLIVRSLGIVALALLGGTALGATINGRVFEDVRYGGGPGRAFTDATGAAAVDDARVELYAPDGDYIGFTATAADGSYQFNVSTWANGTGQYYVRVVNGTVRSTRTGGTGCTACVGVQTYRTDAAGGSAVPVTNRVGGEDPALNDSPRRSSGDDFSELDSPGLHRPQSVTRVQLASNGASVSDVDFGFNFSTIVTTRDASNCTRSGSGSTYYPCQGTLRQFLINADTLGSIPSQAGSGRLGTLTTPLPSGSESSIFMIPADQHTAGVAVIALAAALPTISQSGLRLDATTQTVNIGNTNAALSGTGGTVGALATGFPQFDRPEVQIADAMLTFTGSNQAVHGFALPRGSITTTGANVVVRDNFVGIAANGAVDSSSAMAIVFTGANAQIRSNYASANNSVIRGNSPGAGALVSYNEVVRSSMTPSDTFDGILLIGSASGARIENNLARNQPGAGIELGFEGGTMTNVVITNNTIRQNGFSGSGPAPASTPSAEPVGIAAWNYTGSNVELSLNVIEDNAGPGIVLSNASGTRFSRNRFGNNRGLAIDLNAASADPNSMGSGPGPTLNDVNDADSGANDLLNFPVITAATIVGGEFTLAGFARPGSVIELYVAQPDPTGFGEGLTYIGTFTEGVGDLDAGTGSYSGTINAVNQGADTTNRFLFRGAVPAGISGGLVLTSTATVSNRTSEFGGNVTVTTGPSLVTTKTVRVESDPINNTTNPKSIPGATQRYTIRLTNEGTGTVDNDTVSIVDTIAPNTALCGLAAPVTFVNGSAASGLTFTFSSLGSTTDDVEFSSTASGAPSWTYTPVPDANGCDAAVRHIRIRPKGTMAGSTSGNPYFEVQFTVKIQ